MVHSRLSALDERARLLLRAASVFGERFWSSAVAALVATEGSPASSTCSRRLVAKELLIEQTNSRFAGRAEFAFRHALLREGAYAMLTDEDAGSATGRGALAGEPRRRGSAGPRPSTSSAGATTCARPPTTCAPPSAPASGATPRRRWPSSSVGCAWPPPMPSGSACSAWPASRASTTSSWPPPDWPDAQALLEIAPPGSLPWSQALLGALVAAAQTGERATCSPRPSRSRCRRSSRPRPPSPRPSCSGSPGRFCHLAGQVEHRGSDLRPAPKRWRARPGPWRRADAGRRRLLRHHRGQSGLLRPGGSLEGPAARTPRRGRRARDPAPQVHLGRRDAEHRESVLPGGRRRCARPAAARRHARPRVRAQLFDPSLRAGVVARRPRDARPGPDAGPST